MNARIRGAFYKILFFAAGVLPLEIMAQKGIVTSGGRHIGNGGSSSFSIGQSFYKISNNENFKINQGLQQPFEISFVIVGVEEAIDFSTFMSVFPNPTDQNVNLRVEMVSTEGLYYQLFDSNGRMVLQNKIELQKSVINLNNLPTAVYELAIFNKYGFLKTLKIIKK